MKASVKKTVRWTVFRERADECLLFALSCVCEMEHIKCVSRSENRSRTGFEPHCRRSFNRTMIS